MTMTKEQKQAQKQKLRIAVARDVIRSLPKLNVETGTYMQGNVPESLKTKGSKAIAQALKKNCTVCALGACFLSLVALDNKYTFDFMDNGSIDKDENYFKGNINEDTNIFNRLNKLFSPVQLMLIESAFEGRDMLSRLSADQLGRPWLQDWIDIAIEFGEGAGGDDSNRLLAIMENVIANKGMFIPVPSLKAIE